MSRRASMKWSPSNQVDFSPQQLEMIEARTDRRHHLVNIGSSQYSAASCIRRRDYDNDQARIILPFEQASWESFLFPQLKLIAENKLQFNPTSFCKLLARFPLESCGKPSPNLGALCAFLSSTLTTKESHSFFTATLPFIAQQVLRLAERFSASRAPASSSAYPPSSYLPDLKRGQNLQVTLSQDQVCSLVVSSFFMLLPERSLFHGSTFPVVDFGDLFQNTHPSSQEKLRCFMSYFNQRRINSTSACAHNIVTIQRVCLRSEQMPTSSMLEQNHSLLSGFTIAHFGGICDSGSEYIKTDFANAIVGGGVLRSGSVQEEIMCLEHPEMLAAMLACERMTDNEAIIIKGAQRYCKVSGYSHQIRCEGVHDRPYPQKLAVSGQAPMIDSEIVTIDALDFSHKDPASQYTEAATLRELGKILSGYNHPDSGGGIRRKGVATGNWGCGAFKGDPQYKCLLIWIACSLSGRSVLYYPMNNPSLSGLQDVIDLINRRQSTVSQLYTALSSYHSSIGLTYARSSVFAHILDCFGDSPNSRTSHSRSSKSASTMSSSSMPSTDFGSTAYSSSRRNTATLTEIGRVNLPPGHSRLKTLPLNRFVPERIPPPTMSLERGRSQDSSLSGFGVGHRSRSTVAARKCGRSQQIHSHAEKNRPPWR